MQKTITLELAPMLTGLALAGLVGANIAASLVLLGIDRGFTLPADRVVLRAASTLFGEWRATITDATGLPADRDLRAAVNESSTTGDTLGGAVLADIT